MILVKLAMQVWESSVGMPLDEAILIRVLIIGGNYQVINLFFTMVMVIYHYVERIWGILVTPNFLYNIYDNEIYYPGEPVNIHIQ